MWYGVVALALLCAGVLAVPLELTTQSIVITSEAPSTEPKTTSTAVSTKPQLKSFKVTSNIGFRYAVTEVSSKVLNPAGQPQTAGFSVVLPETAFISGFLMEIEGKVYKAHVKEKEEAKKVYDAAVSAGQFAAHVSVSARDSNKFEVDVSIPAQQKAVFNLTYEELLTRKVGVYNHVLNLNPGQIVKDMTVDVYITENRPINTLRVPELRTGNEIDADESDPNSSIASIEHAENDKKAHIHFAPTPLEQQRLIDDLKNKEKKENAGSRRRHNPFHPDSSNDNPHDEGVKGQFVVQYDVERDPEAGEILVYDGYFVHFFSPSDLKPLPKHVVFVLDRSGSMYNEKIRQLREAMTYILSDLKPEDYFNIVEFSYSAKAWNIDNYEDSPVFVSKSSDNYWGYQETGKTGPPPEPYPATPENINKAKQLVQNLTADGGTNIYDALDTGMKIANKGLLKSAGVNVTRPEPMIIFLTDGDPTVGETSLEKIYAVVEENKLGPKSPSIFSLAFGEDADRNFLRKLSLRNHGFLRHIYEAADASKQLQHFYREVSSPLLSNVKFTYPENQIEEATITRHAFPILFKGTELVVTGKLVPEVQAIESSIEASGSHGLWRCDYPIRPIIPTPPPPPKAERKTAPLERLWAYLTIKQLLDQNDADLPKPSTPDVVDGPTESSSSTEAALVDPVQTGKKKETPKEKALKLALEYSFVTPLTSLVVVKPNETERAVNAESAKPGSGHGGYGVALPLSLNAVSNRGPVGTSYYSAPGLPGPPAYPIAGPGGSYGVGYTSFGSPQFGPGASYGGGYTSSGSPQFGLGGSYGVGYTSSGSSQFGLGGSYGGGYTSSGSPQFGLGGSYGGGYTSSGSPQFGLGGSYGGGYTSSGSPQFGLGGSYGGGYTSSGSPQFGLGGSYGGGYTSSGSPQFGLGGSYGGGYTSSGSPQFGTHAGLGYSSPGVGSYPPPYSRPQQINFDAPAHMQSNSGQYTSLLPRYGSPQGVGGQGYNHGQSSSRRGHGTRGRGRARGGSRRKSMEILNRTSYPTPGRPAATYQTTELHDTDAFEEEDLSATVDSVFVSTSAAPVITTSTQGLLPELRGYEWLQSYVTDGKLVLEIAGVQKTYNLTAEYVSEEPQCPSTIRATPGTCVPFSQCVSAGSLTDTIDKLRNHICEVKGYAGVCCDPQDKDSELTFNP